MENYKNLLITASKYIVTYSDVMTESKMWASRCSDTHINDIVRAIEQAHEYKGIDIKKAIEIVELAPESLEEQPDEAMPGPINTLTTKEGVKYSWSSPFKKGAWCGYLKKSLHSQDLNLVIK